MVITLPACTAAANAPAPPPPRELVVREMQLPPVRALGFTENPAGQTTYGVEHDGLKHTFQFYSKGPSKTPRPAILLLHGAGRTGISLVQEWMDLAAQQDIILIGPTATSGWNPNRDEPFEFIDAVLATANRVQPIDFNRLYVFGHSLGANYTLLLAAARSEKFAAAAIHAGQLNGRSFRRIRDAVRKLPMLFINGTKDRIFAIGPVTKSAEAFADQGHPTVLYLLKGHTHWYYDDAPTINRMAWQFLSFYNLRPAAVPAVKPLPATPPTKR